MDPNLPADRQDVGNEVLEDEIEYCSTHNSELIGRGRTKWCQFCDYSAC